MPIEWSQAVAKRFLAFPGEGAAPKLRSPAVIAAVADPAQALAVGERLLVLEPPYMLYEEAVPHVPTLAKAMGDAGRQVVEGIVARAYNATARMPFAELLACYR